MIENAGEDRQIAVQIFIDYIQVPMIIEGETYQTFFVDTDVYQMLFHSDLLYIIGEDAIFLSLPSL